jgi:uncharacterized protein (DUF58 family)
MADSLLDKEFLERLEYLHIVTRELFVGHAAAGRISRKFGVGLEFADFRNYTQGDDYRHLDWAAYARRDELVVKLFSEERTARIYFIVDASRSMSVGRPQKLFFAKQIAAALAYTALANLDSVAVVSFDQRLRDASRTFEGAGQRQRMLETLDAIQPTGDATDIGSSIREFAQRFPKRGLVILLSDFFDRPGYEAALKLLHHHRFELIALQVNDRDEVDPSATGDLELVDAESSAKVTVRLTPATLAAYRKQFALHYSELERLCKAFKRGHMAVVTDTPLDQLIFEVFRKGGFLR